MTILGYILATILVPEVTAPPAKDGLAQVLLAQDARTPVIIDHQALNAQTTSPTKPGQGPRYALSPDSAGFDLPPKTAPRQATTSPAQNLLDKLTPAPALLPDRNQVTVPPGPRPSPVQERRASLNAADWELASALQALATQTSVNIVLASRENPKITIQLRDMRLPEILRVIAAVTGLRFVQAGDTYVVATEEVLKAAYPLEHALAYPDPQAQEAVPFVVATYTCSHVTAAQAVQALADLVDKDSRLLVAFAPGPDVPTFASAGPASGANAPANTGTPAQSPPGAANPNAPAENPNPGISIGAVGGNGRRVIIRGPEKEVQEALALLAKIDVRRPQVRIKVSIMDVQNDAVRDLGLTWTFSNVRLTERTPSGIGFETIDRSPLSFEGIIRALQTTERARVLAEPALSVLDGQSAYILIGERINYPVVIGLTDNNTPIFDIREERVGVYLQVGAHVTEAQEIVLNLYPQVSSITGFLQVNGANYPQVSTREAQTVLRVRSGDTIAVGGLISQEEIERWDRVPLLADIPILGELFKKRRTVRNQSEVVIFLTPIILADEPGSGAP